ncbi:MAG: amino acid ABC transporter ATP-binding protein [Brevinema sp.]
MYIRFEELSHQFDQDNLVLNHLNFEDECSSLAIIGPSGGGKSTLLKILGGLIYPSQGNFYFDHQLINFVQNHDWYKKIGFVFQSNGLFPHLTGVQNILLPLTEVFNIPIETAKQQVYQLLERFGLDKDAHKYPHQLSGGQCQRIAIVRAVVVNPKLLLLDEPTSALDPEYTSEVLDMVHELTLEGQHIILVTHEMGFARLACETVMFLHSGKIIEYNDSKKLFESPQNPLLKSFLNKILEWK